MKGSEHEVAFWKNFVKTDRFLNGWLSDEKTPELNDLVYMFLKGQPEADVLDCGSGVVSILHGTVKRSNLFSCDPLANEYAKIFDYNGKISDTYFSPNPVACEDLEYENQFDVVHISNALDHCQQPSVAYQKMLQAVKPGGFLIVQGFVNEGTHENWQGFHQFNIDIKELITNQTEYTALLISSKNGDSVIYSNPYFSRKIHIDLLGRDWLIWIAQKPFEA
jgi:SAM-dependent methyltransferase